MVDKGLEESVPNFDNPRGLDDDDEENEEEGYDELNYDSFASDDEDDNSSNFDDLDESEDLNPDDALDKIINEGYVPRIPIRNIQEGSREAHADLMSMVSNSVNSRGVAKYMDENFEIDNEILDEDFENVVNNQFSQEEPASVEPEEEPEEEPVDEEVEEVAVRRGFQKPSAVPEMKRVPVSVVERSSDSQEFRPESANPAFMNGEAMDLATQNFLLIEKAKQMNKELTTLLKSVNEISVSVVDMVSKVNVTSSNLRKESSDVQKMTLALEMQLDKSNNFLSDRYLDNMQRSAERLLSSYIDTSRSQYVDLFRLAVKNYRDFSDAAMKFQKSMESRVSKEFKNLVRLVYIGVPVLIILHLVLIGLVVYKFYLPH